MAPMWHLSLSFSLHSLSLSPSIAIQMFILLHAYEGIYVCGHVHMWIHRSNFIYLSSTNLYYFYNQNNNNILFPLENTNSSSRGVIEATLEWGDLYRLNKAKQSWGEKPQIKWEDPSTITLNNLSFYCPYVPCRFRVLGNFESAMNQP